MLLNSTGQNWQRRTRYGLLYRDRGFRKESYPGLFIGLMASRHLLDIDPSNFGSSLLNGLWFCGVICSVTWLLSSISALFCICGCHDSSYY